MSTGRVPSEVSKSNDCCKEDCCKEDGCKEDRCELDLCDCRPPRAGRGARAGAAAAALFAPPEGCIGASVGIGTTFGLGTEFWKREFSNSALCRDAHGDSDTGCAECGAASWIGRPPGSASSAGAAADIKGYISGAGRGEGACKRRPQRLQRRSSASFEALQNWQSMWSYVRPLLTRFFPLCYGSRLGFNFYERAGHHETRPAAFRTKATFLANILPNFCHAFCSILLRLILLATVLTTSQAQDFRPDMPAPPVPVTPSPNVNVPVKPPRPGAPDSDHILIESVTQEVVGPLRHLRGMVRVETSDTLLRADEVDYNSDTGDVEARGHVHLEQFTKGQKLDCDHATYNVNTDSGKFYVVTGTALPRIHANPGTLTTTNPFTFQAAWVDKLQDRYILHDSFLTDCLLPRPWWQMRGKEFDITVNQKVTAHHAWFYLLGVPVFYTPIFYKALEKQPRRSGILLPSVGNSTLRGPLINYGYYWAINRSYDVLYTGQYFPETGTSEHVYMRGDVSATTNFHIQVDSVTDTRNLNPSRSGFEIAAAAKTNLGHGWEARGDLNYLSSFNFVQYYAESFNEAVWGETHSTGYVDKHFKDYALYFVVQQNVNYQSVTPNDDIVIRKLPEARFLERDHQFDLWGQPFWFSFQSTAGFQSRSQPLAEPVAPNPVGPLLETGFFVPRVDVAPQVNTAFHWEGINIVPSFGIRETEYGSSLAANGSYTGPSLWRNSREFKVDVLLPSLQKIFDAPKWVGQKVKHVIEPRITYTDNAGVHNFGQIIRFDDTDILSNTNQVEFALTNRLLAKNKDGIVTDFFTWQLFYDRYFDPTFGGAVIPGERNVVQAILDLTGYSFLDGLRHSSPVVNAFRMQQGRMNIDWRLDYDPVVHRIVNSSASVNWRLNKYFFNFGDTDLRANSVLAPISNQVNTTVGYGQTTKQGWGAALGVFYDVRTSTVDFTQFQVTYNTDCCGVSVQYRRFNLGARDETFYRFSFTISNIGTVGSLPRQERMF